MKQLVVVGNGMAGARLVEDVLARGGAHLFDITIFGDEPYGNYNRILLSSVLAGTHDSTDIYLNPISWYAEHGVTLRAGIGINAIDLAAKRVRGADGTLHPYDKLVIATGSNPFLPSMAGVYGENGEFRDGVFVFRTLDDCSRILDYAPRARTAAVIGGGLLGLEAARGLLTRGLQVHVMHLMPHLMEVQLDRSAAAVLQRRLEQMGLRVHLEKVTSAVLGNGRVSGLAFKDGSTLDCDMVVISAGIRPNVRLAVQTGLDVERGIVVGDDLACRNAPEVYAVGECAQHRGRVYGLVAPLWEQTDILADRLTGRNPDARYLGSRTSTKLKVMGVDLTVMGDKEPIHEDDEVVSYVEPARGIYKKLIVRKNRLAGAIVLGDNAIAPGLFHAFDQGAELAENRAEHLFPLTGEWAPPSIESIPDTAQICDCNGVSKARIVEAVMSGCRSLTAVCETTRAGTGCGSCRPQVQGIVEFVCKGVAAAGDSVQTFDGAQPPGAAPPAPSVVQKAGASKALTKIEQFKKEKDGLDVVHEIPRYAREGWEAITEGDRERLKWLGVFFRRQTPGRFMMRVRMPNGMSSSTQFRALAGISEQFGTGFVDLTTRQQVQLRGYEIGHVQAIWRRLDEVGLVSLQTGMDNIRNVAGCPVAGLTPNELLDASPAVREFTETFLRNKAYTNLPRKLNVTITGCKENCTHAETQDIALVPALKEIEDYRVEGFNVLAGGKMGSGGYRIASPLNVFVRPDDAAAICSHITLIFRDHGSRDARNRARLAFLIEEWGIDRFRRELERRHGRLLTAGADVRTETTNDHIGIHPQKQRGLYYVGLLVPVGRITSGQLREVARTAETYGTGEIRITTAQNLLVPNVPREQLVALTADPLLRELRHDPSDMLRGLVSCTGIDYCHFALIETKELALKTARQLEQLQTPKPLTIHWSACPAGCGNHAAADIGLLGKNVRANGEVIDAVDIFVGGRSGPNAKPGIKLLEDVPCDDLPGVLERLVPVMPYLALKGASAVERNPKSQ